MTKVLIDHSLVERTIDTLEELYLHTSSHEADESFYVAITELRAALEQPQVEQEPVAYRHRSFTCGPWEYVSLDDKQRFREGMGQPLYTRPQPKREPLTEDEILKVGWAVKPFANRMEVLAVGRAIEHAHEIGSGS